jgi:glucosamine-6-phosphate deaminase
MDIIIKKTYEEISKAAADLIAEELKNKKDLVLGLATGGTPIGAYKELVRMHKEENLDFSKVVTFNLDEYLGIGMDMTKSPDEDQSYARFMHEHLFKDINVNSENIHVPDGLTKDPEAYCQWYEDEIKKAGGIDIQVLGIGGDGHWAFNEPGASLGSRTRVEPLTKQTIDDNYKAFYKKAGVSKDDMPCFALTMGIGTILGSRHALMIVNGEKKADVVQKALEGPVTSQITSSAIQLHPGRVTVILDEPAASKLKNKEHYIHVQEMKKKHGVK